jgi:flagellar biosynthesis anti-sigma factor FlgM
MEIHGDRPIDPARRRAQDTARGLRTPVPQAGTGAAAGATFDLSDRATVARLVDAVQQLNPVDVHRVAQLRQRIADGSYRADPEELADLLLHLRYAAGPGSGNGGKEGTETRDAVRERRPQA